MHAVYPAFSFWQMGVVNAISLLSFPQALNIYVCMYIHPCMYIFLIYQTECNWKLKPSRIMDSPNWFMTLTLILHLHILKLREVDFHRFPSAVFNRKLWPPQALQGLLCSYLCISILAGEAPLVSLHMQKPRLEFFDTPCPFVGGLLFSIVWLLMLAKVIYLTMPGMLCLILLLACNPKTSRSSLKINACCWNGYILG